MSSPKLFPGLVSFGSDEADIFFGREKEIEQLLSLIERDPVIVVNGLSGCGKSSLIKAGIIPHLEEAEKLVIYTSVVENIIDDVGYTVKHLLGSEELPQDYVEALQELYEKGPRPGSLPARALIAEKYDLAAVRNLLRNALTDRDLRRFCQDRPTFRPVIDDFGPGFSFNDMIDAVIEYCLRKQILEDLLSEMEESSPRQYEKHRDAIHRVGAPKEAPRKDKARAWSVSRKPIEPGQPIVLVVDQFERALHISHSLESLKTFMQGISRLISQAYRFVTIIILLRADWLYYLESSVRQFYPRLNVYSYVFTLDPLTRKAAREAIVGPLEANELPFDAEVVDDIVNSLQRNSVGASVGDFVQPIQLQIVLDALLDLAEAAGSPQQAFTRENYQQSGGVESILRNYLTNSVGSRSDAWRLLARFIAQDRKTGRTIRRSELLSVPAAKDIESELDFLVNQRLLEAYEAEDTDDTYYRLTHDYLVEAIVDYLNQNPDHQGWKLAEDWLGSGTLEWLDSTQLGDGDGLLLEENRYLHIYQYKDKLNLTDESQRLLILTALRHGHEGLGHWLSRGPNPEDDVRVVAEKLLVPKLEVQQAARDALAGCVEPSDKTVTALEDNEKLSLRDKLRRAMDSPANSAERDAAARALWTLHSFDTSRDRLQTGAIVFRRWLRDHSRQIVSYVLPVFLVLVLVFGGLYINNRLQGDWRPIQTLKAGTTPLAVVDPSQPDKLYVITKGGPGPREGVSLFVLSEGTWELRSRDFSKAWLTSLLVVPGEDGTRLYATLYYDGVVRSTDGGENWELVNRGLPSHNLTSMVIDPNDPRTLYVATDDGMGVLQSTNGGDSWQFYDYRGEIYGTELTMLAYTRANGGALIAGTRDGRILLHRRDATDWQPHFGLSKGAINVITVAQADPNHVYAGTSRGVILHSHNGGKTWEPLGQPAHEFRVTAIVVAPDDPGRLYVAAYGDGGFTIWKSQDMGQTWEMIPGVGLPRVWISSLAFAGPTANKLVAGTGDGLFISGDGGSTWEQESLEAPLASIQKMALSPGHSAPVYVAIGGSVYVNDGSIFSGSRDGFQKWLHGDGLEAEIVRALVADPDDPQVAYAGVLLLGNWSVFVTRDGGQTWQRTTAPPIEPVVPDTYALALGKSPDGRKVLYAGTVGCGVFRSENGGNSWDTLDRSRCNEVTGKGMPSDVSFLAVDAQDPDVVYAAAGQHVYYSLDGGTWWQQVKPEINSPIMGLAADPIEPDTAYLITGSDGFWRSDDGGQTWQQQGAGRFAGAELTVIATVQDQVGHLILGASNGEVWETSNGGETWRSIRKDLAVSSISSIVAGGALEGKILVGSLNDGMALFVPGRVFGGAE